MDKLLVIFFFFGNYERRKWEVCPEVCTGQLSLFENIGYQKPRNEYFNQNSQSAHWKQNNKNHLFRHFFFAKLYYLFYDWAYRSNIFFSNLVVLTLSFLSEFACNWCFDIKILFKIRTVFKNLNHWTFQWNHTCIIGVS